MFSWRSIGFVLLLGVTACSARGCGGEQIVVKVRGPKAPAVKAAVVSEGIELGFVDEVLSGGGVHRTIIRIPKAAALTDQDRFLIVVDKRGLEGFQVIPGKGNPLKDGDEVEADPFYSARAEVARSNAPGGVTLPSGYFVPYPKALTLTIEDRRKQEEIRFADHTEKFFKQKRLETLNLRVDLRARFKALGEASAGLTAQQFLDLYRDRGAALVEDLETARNSADSMEQRRHTERLVKGLRNQKKQAERVIRREERARKRVVPPEFR